MKRTLPLFVLIGVVGLLVPVLAVFGKPPATPKAEPQASYSSATIPSGSYTPCCAAPTAAPASSGNDQIIDELTTILKETKSTETFTVTVMVLARMGPSAKRALPVIIRNAERLELFEDLYSANASTEKRACQELAAALGMIVDNKKGWGSGPVVVSPMPTHCAPAAYAPPACYSPVCPAPLSGTPVPSWNAPVAVPATPVAPAAKPDKPAQPLAPSPF